MLLWFDGFDHHTATPGTDVRSTTGILNRDYTSVGNVALTLQTMPGGQGLGLRFRENDFGSFMVTKQIYDTAVTSGTLGAGFRVYYNFISSASGSEHILFQFGNFGDYAVSVCMGGIDGRLYVTGQGGIGNRLGSKGSVLNIGTLYHIEVKVVLGTGTSGSVEVRLNGAQDILVENVNTLNLTGGNIDRFRLYRNSVVTFQNVIVDDLFVWDNTGTKNNDWVGQKFVLTQFPDGDTATEEWALSVGSDSFDLVNDVPPNTGTDISSSTAGEKTEMTLENLPSTAWVPVGVMVKGLVDKSGTGVASVEIGADSGGVEDLSSGQDVVQNVPRYINHIIEDDPNGGGGLTATVVNGLNTVIRITP